MSASLREWGLDALQGVACTWAPAVRAARRGPTVVALELNGQIDKRALAGVLALEDLEHLALGQVKGITNAWLAKLGELPKLRSLDLWRTPLSDVGATALAVSRTLEWIDVRNTKIGDAGLAALARIPTLRQLSCTATTRMPDDGIRALASAAKLEALAIVRPPFTLQATWIQQLTIDALARCPRLRALSLYGVLGGCRLDALGQLHELIELSAGSSYHPAQRGWMADLVSLRRIECIDLSDCEFERPSDLAPLASLEHLTDLNLWGARATGPGEGPALSAVTCLVADAAWSTCFQTPSGTPRSLCPGFSESKGSSARSLTSSRRRWSTSSAGRNARRSHAAIAATRIGYASSPFS